MVKLMLKRLKPVQLNAVQSFSRLELEGQGGMLSIKIPAFVSNQVGAYELGIYDNYSADPAYVFSDEFAIAPYSRYVSTYVPPGLVEPVVGLKLVQHEDLENTSIGVTLSAQLESLHNQRQECLGKTEWARPPSQPALPAAAGTFGNRT